MSEEEPWAAVGPAEVLTERGAVEDLSGERVFLHRAERIFAIRTRSTHQGAPLARGSVRASARLVTITCAAHGSTFNLENGRVMRGPATQPVAAYDVRVIEGSVELRRRKEDPQ